MSKPNECPSWGAYKTALSTWKADKTDKAKRVTLNSCRDAVVEEAGLPASLKIADNDLMTDPRL